MNPSVGAIPENSRGKGTAPVALVQAGEGVAVAEVVPAGDPVMFRRFPEMGGTDPRAACVGRERDHSAPAPRFNPSLSAGARGRNIPAERRLVRLFAFRGRAGSDLMSGRHETWSRPNSGRFTRHGP